MMTNDMTDKPKASAEKERRAFLKKAGAVAVTAPAVALLLSKGAKAGDFTVESGSRGEECELHRPWAPASSSKTQASTSSSARAALTT